MTRHLLAIAAADDHTGAVLAGIAALIAATLSGVAVVIGALAKRTTNKVNAAVNDQPGPKLSERVVAIEATVHAHREEAIEWRKTQDEKLAALDRGQIEILRRLPD